jgi:DNA-binding NtrC family response regulator
MRILVIDDDKAHGESLIDLLASLEHEGLYATGYEDAQWLFELFQFDVVILDFDMPRTTGPVAAARLAQRFPDMLTVIVSAHEPTEERREQIGDLHFLPKPIAPTALEALLQAVERSRLGTELMRRAAFPLVKYGPPDE